MSRLRRDRTEAYEEQTAATVLRSDTLSFLRRHFLLIAAFTLGALALGLLFVVLSPTKYRSSAQLLIDPRGLQILKNEITRSGDSTDGNLVDIENQRYVLLSRSVLQGVVEREHLAEHPMFAGGGGMVRSILGLFGLKSEGAAIDAKSRAVAALADSVEVVRGERAYVLEVAVTTRDREMSARLANIIAKTYLEEQNAARTRASKRASEELSRRAEDLRQEVQRAEQAVERYRAEHKLSMSNGLPISEGQISNLSNQISEVRGRVAEAQGRIDAIERARRAGVTAITSDALNAAVMTPLRAQLAQAQQQVASLSTQLGPRHPALQQAEMQLQDARRQVAAELDRLASAARADLSRAKANEAALEKRLGELRAQDDVAGPSRVALRDLERAAETSRTIYLAFVSRAKELNEGQGIDSSNARIISPAIPAIRAAGAPAWLALAGALLFGLLSGAGAGYLRDRLSAPAEEAVVADDWDDQTDDERRSMQSPPKREASHRRGARRVLVDFFTSPGKRGAPAQLIARKEKLDALADRLALGEREGPRAIAFVGAGAHDLQSQLAAAFAEYMSWEGMNVTLLDAAEKAREELRSAFGEDEMGDKPGDVRVAALDRLGARALRRLADDSDILMIDAPDALNGAGVERALKIADRIVWVVEEDNDDSHDALDYWLSERPDLEDRLAGRVVIARRAA